ncbi:TPA: hypothetical protein ACUNF5_006829 [Burkholderia orbicola]
MTIVALWYSESNQGLSCAADTRISGGAATITDSGPKIFQVPVNLTLELSGGRGFERANNQSFGFTFAGSALAAISTYSLATACTQNLCGMPDSPRSVSVEEIARLFRSAAEHYIVDMGSRLGVNAEPTQYFFDSIVFGYCPVLAEFKAFNITPKITGGRVHVEITEMPISRGVVHAIGSGRHEFARLYAERVETRGSASPIGVLKEMLRTQAPGDVGGHIQFGVDNKSGFRILPVLHEIGDPMQWPTTFLGWDATPVSPIGGYTVGYTAVGFDTVD